MACPEVNDPPTYTLTRERCFIADKNDPKSAWLEPGQDVAWTVSPCTVESKTITVIAPREGFTADITGTTAGSFGYGYYPEKQQRS